MAEGLKPRIVLSGVNFVEAGPLAIMQDALDALAGGFPEYEVHALVHRQELFHTKSVVYHEYPDVKSSWVRRLSFEYFQCKSISEQIQPRLWLAMHDITPRVTAEVQAVYCHNPAPFYRMGLREALLSYKFTMFALLYRYLYGIGMQKNDYVVVQQDWIRQAFQQRYKPKQIIVAHPSVEYRPGTQQQERGAGEPFRFFYPAFPRSFKNVEVLLEATRLLLEGDQAPEFVLRLTMDGTENRYARQLRETYGSMRGVEWLGALSRDAVMAQYTEVDAMVFPSRLETWGMPLTEFKATGKPILAADLPYAPETVGDYGAVTFLNAPRPADWFEAMWHLCKGSPIVGSATAAPIAQPYVKNWHDLFLLLLGRSSRG